MNKKFQLSIAEPCHENWDKMTSAEKGRFCASCQKQVVDFSGMSDREIVAFFKKPNTGSVCGRFVSDQLNRDIVIPRKRIPWVKYFFQFALPAFLFSIKASSQKLMGKVRIESSSRVCKNDTIPVIVQPSMVGEVFVNPLPLKKTQTTISGVVVDESGSPVPYASIFIKGTTTGTAAKENGEFMLTVLGPGKTVTLIISSVGFEVLEREFKTAEILKIQPVLMTATLITMGLFIKKEDQTPKTSQLMKPANDSAFNDFRIYPNPVQSGSELTIEWIKPEEGYYSMELISASGKTVHKRKIWVDSAARLLNLDFPGNIRGIYFVLLTSHRSGRSYRERIVVE